MSRGLTISLQWPQAMRGVVVGNEVLDAMPVQLLYFDGDAWHERGVAWHAGGFTYADMKAEIQAGIRTDADTTVARGEQGPDA